MSAEAIRPARADDLPAIRAFDEMRDVRAREIAEGRCLLAEIEGRAAGYVSWVPAGFVGNDFVSFLMVAPWARRRGLAGRLLAAAEARLAPGKLFISTESDHALMRAFLPARGWRLAGTVADANPDGRAECFYVKRLG